MTFIADLINPFDLSQDLSADQATLLEAVGVTDIEEPTSLLDESQAKHGIKEQSLGGTQPHVRLLLVVLFVINVFFSLADLVSSHTL